VKRFIAAIGMVTVCLGCSSDRQDRHASEPSRKKEQVESQQSPQPRKQAAGPALAAMEGDGREQQDPSDDLMPVYLQKDKELRGLERIAMTSSWLTDPDKYSKTSVRLSEGLFMGIAVDELTDASKPLEERLAELAGKGTLVMWVQSRGNDADIESCFALRRIPIAKGKLPDNLAEEIKSRFAIEAPMELDVWWMDVEGKQSSLYIDIR